MNGNLVIQDAQKRNVTIDTNNPDDIEQKLRQLNTMQIAVIKQLADKHTNELNDTFRTLLSRVISQKNIVQDNIFNAGFVNIGDEIHYHYHIENAKIPQALTAKIPKTSQERIIGRQTELEDLHKRLLDNKQDIPETEERSDAPETETKAY